MSGHATQDHQVIMDLLLEVYPKGYSTALSAAKRGGNQALVDHLLKHKLATSKSRKAAV